VVAGLVRQVRGQVPQPGVASAGRVLAEDVGVGAQSDGGIGVAQAGGDHVDRDSREQQCGRVQVA